MPARASVRMSSVPAPDLLAGARRSGASSTGSGTLVVGGLVVRRWAVVLGTTPRGLVVGGAVVAVVLAAVGAALAGRVPERRDELVTFGLVVAVWAVAAGFGILAAHALTVPPSLAFLRTLPVDRRSVEAAAALPLGVLGAAGLLVVGPPAVVATAAASGQGGPVAAAALALVAVGGGAVGVLLHGLAGRATAGTAAAPLRLTITVLAWFALVGAALAGALPLLERLGDGAAAMLLAPLGWSLPWLALVDPGPAPAVGALGGDVVLVAAAMAARTVTVARRGDPAVRRLLLDGPAPLVQVEARRLLRHPRTLEAIVVAGATGAALAVGAAWATSRVPGAVDPRVVALLGAQVTSAPAALARGLSDRRRPAEAVLGIGPGRHVLALAGAGLAVVIAAAAPGVLLTAYLFSPTVAAAWLAALVPFTSVAVAVSVVLTPELGNGSAEAGAVLAAAALTTVLVALAGDLSPVPSVGLGALATLAALVAATAVERSHRRPS